VIPEQQHRPVAVDDLDACLTTLESDLLPRVLADRGAYLSRRHEVQPEPVLVLADLLPGGSEPLSNRLVGVRGELVELPLVHLGFRRFFAAQAARFTQFFKVSISLSSSVGSADVGLIVSSNVARRSTATICRNDHSLSHAPIVSRIARASGEA